MKWSSDAEAALKKVPFFVRSKVRKTIELQVGEKNKKQVTLADVQKAQKRFLNRMAEDIRGYQADTCFGPSGCPYRAVACDSLMRQVEERLAEADLLGFLKQTVGDQLKYHHEFRVSAAECPNACSQPQIRDMGIIGAVVPVITDEVCTGCAACVSVCPDSAVTIDHDRGIPVINSAACLMCGRCITACPAGTIRAGQKGFRVQLGGRLGRHPRLGMELPAILSEAQVLEVLDNALCFYKARSRKGARFSRLLTEQDLETIFSGQKGISKY
jgi:dissimilatory sulfite reductase (desulfoviridin) alpha/beta subunit